MTSAFDDDDWGRPIEASGDYARPDQMQNHLLIVIPIGYVEHSLTKFTQPGKKSDAIVCDVIDLDDADPSTGAPGRVYRATWLRQAQLIMSLRPQIGRKVLGRIARGVPKNGMNPPWVIVDMSTDPQCRAQAQSWVQANPTFAVSTFREPDPVVVAPTAAPGYPPQPPAYPPQQPGYGAPYGQQQYPAPPQPTYQPQSGYQPPQGGYQPPQGGYVPPAPPPPPAWETYSTTPPQPPAGYPPPAPPQPPAGWGNGAPQQAPQPPAQYAPPPAPGYPAGVTDVNTLEAMRQERARREQQGTLDNPPF